MHSLTSAWPTASAVFHRTRRTRPRYRLRRRDKRGTIAAIERALELILAPMLKIRYPGGGLVAPSLSDCASWIKGDRGPSSLDWATTEKSWGVSTLEAAKEFDVGPIWASHEFARKSSHEKQPVSKSGHRSRRAWWCSEAVARIESASSGQVLGNHRAEVAQRVGPVARPPAPRRWAEYGLLIGARTRKESCGRSAQPTALGCARRAARQELLFLRGASKMFWACPAQFWRAATAQSVSVRLMARGAGRSRTEGERRSRCPLGMCAVDRDGRRQRAVRFEDQVAGTGILDRHRVVGADATAD